MSLSSALHGVLAAVDNLSRQLVPSFDNVGIVTAISIVLVLLCAFFGREDDQASGFPIPFAVNHLKHFVRRRWETWSYLLRGVDIIQDKFNKSEGKPFEIFAPDNRYVFVSSPRHIKELDNAPDTVLSLQAASKQMLQPIYTMHGFNWFDRRGTEGVGFVRALRTLLTNNLPQILPDLTLLNRTQFVKLRDAHPVRNGKVDSPVYHMIVSLVVSSNALSFFGEELTRNGPFMVAALRYIEETLICAEVVRLVPKWMSSTIGNIIAKRLKSHETIFNALLVVAQQRCQERDSKLLGHKVPDHADCIQWIMETSPKKSPWTPDRIVHELMAIWFGSVHALSTTIVFAIHDLCLHQEYIEPLRREIAIGYADFESSANGLPLLDSFIKESARLSPVESMSTRRSALLPFTLSDGTTVHVGDWACTPVRAIMADPASYPSPLEFNGFRFAPTEAVQEAGSNFLRLQEKPTKFTDVDNTFHVWGTGRMACPGRYYAAAVIKVILSQIITDYDFELVDSESPRWMTWRSTMLPLSKTKVVFTPRQS